MREAKLRVKIAVIFIFDAKLRFALLASLRSAIFSETEVLIFQRKLLWGADEKRVKKVYKLT